MTSRTFLNFDGTYTADISTAPVNYIATDGTFQPIDTMLVASDKQGFAAANTTNTLKTYLPGTAGGTVRVETGDASVSFQPQNASNNSGSVSGSTETFSAWSNAALSYTVQPNRLKETVTLNNASAPSSFSYALSCDGLTPRLNEDKSVSLLDGSGNAALVIAKPWMKDADGNVSVAITVSLMQTQNGLVYSLAPSAEWLASASYPVTLDPTVTGNPTGGAVLTKDIYGTTGRYAYVSAASGEATAYAVGYGTSSDGPVYNTASYRTALQFGSPTSSLDIEVNSATLSLDYGYRQFNPYPLANYTATVNVTPYAYTKYYSSFSTGVNWNDISSVTGFVASPAHAFTNSLATGVVSLDVTEVIRNWADLRGTYDSATTPVTYHAGGLEILLASDLEDGVTSSTPSKTILYFYSDYAPQLSVNYSAPGWYTFQGNMRRTGRSQYTVTGNATQAWLASVTDGGVYGTPPIASSVTAVPDPDALTSGLPILYVAGTGFTANQGGFPYGTQDSYIYRLKDNGSSVDYTAHYHLAEVVADLSTENLAVTGTPLIYNNKIYVTGNFVQSDQVTPTSTGGRLYVLVATKHGTGGTAYYTLDLDSATLTTSGNPIHLGAPTLGSPCPNPYNGGVILTTGDPNNAGTAAKIYCKSSTDGHDLWSSSGQTLYSGLTNSSPSSDGKYVYVGTTGGWLNARNLSDGSAAWHVQGGYANSNGTLVTSSGNVQSSASVYNNQEYFGLLANSVAGSVTSYDNTATTPSFIWGIKDAFVGGYGQNLADMWTTPAIMAEDKETIFGDVNGIVNAVSTGTGTSHKPVSLWASAASLSGTLHASPLIASAPHAPTGATSKGFAWVAVDDDNGAATLHVLDAASGSLVNSYALLDAIDASGDVHASMAAFGGSATYGRRLYVLTTGLTAAEIASYAYPHYSAAFEPEILYCFSDTSTLP